jgi:hypothetical protein
VRAIATGVIGPAQAAHARVERVVVVDRVTLREVVDPRELAKPGRVARTAELSSAPKWMRPLLNGTSLAPWTDPRGGGCYRGSASGAVSAVQPAMREVVQRWIDDLRADTGYDPIVEIGAQRDRVAVVRVPRSGGFWTARPARMLVGLDSGKVLARFYRRWQLSAFLMASPLALFWAWWALFHRCSLHWCAPEAGLVGAAFLLAIAAYYAVPRVLPAVNEPGW